MSLSGGRMEISGIEREALEVLKPEQLWIDPDCGLKTRTTEETIAKLKVLVKATKEMRASLK